jgi:hypothetical protein
MRIPRTPGLFPPDSETGDTNALPVIWDDNKAHRDRHGRIRALMPVGKEKDRRTAVTSHMHHMPDSRNSYKVWGGQKAIGVAMGVDIESDDVAEVVDPI